MQILLCCCLLLLGFAPTCLGQVVLYKSADNRLYTRRQVDSLVEARNEQAKAKGLAFIFSWQEKNTSIRHDTTVHEFGLQATTAGVRKNQEKYSAFVGRPLPPFTLSDLAGKPLTSSSLLGKPVVINMWFTTCQPCIAEMPVLNRIQQEKAGVVFLAMTFNSREKVQAFLQKYAFTFRHVAGAQVYCQRFTDNYPISIFVNRQGIITTILGGIPEVYDTVQRKPSGKMNDKEFYAALKQIE